MSTEKGWVYLRGLQNRRPKQHSGTYFWRDYYYIYILVFVEVVRLVLHKQYEAVRWWSGAGNQTCCLSPVLENTRWIWAQSLDANGHTEGRGTHQSKQRVRKDLVTCLTRKSRTFVRERPTTTSIFTDSGTGLLVCVSPKRCTPVLLINNKHSLHEFREQTRWNTQDNN